MIEQRYGGEQVVEVPLTNYQYVRFVALWPMRLDLLFLAQNPAKMMRAGAGYLIISYSLSKI